MSKQLVCFFLHELATIRIHCQMGCGTVLEIPVESLDEKYEQGKCPVCQNIILPVQSNHLKTLAEAIRGLNKAQKKVKIEFLLPDGGAAAQTKQT